MSLKIDGIVDTKYLVAFPVASRCLTLCGCYTCYCSIVSQGFPLSWVIDPSSIMSYLRTDRGAWVAQLVKRLTSTQVMISQLVSSSPALGSVLTAQSLEPPSDSVSPSLSLCPSPAHSLYLSLKNKC